MQLLIQLNKGGLTTERKNDDKDGFITMNELAAQAFVFYLAGFETSSTAMTFALYELALNQEMQDKAREEIKAVLKRYDGKVTYEGIMEMQYMQKVLEGNETPETSFLVSQTGLSIFRIVKKISTGSDVGQDVQERLQNTRM